MFQPVFKTGKGRIKPALAGSIPALSASLRSERSEERRLPRRSTSEARSEDGRVRVIDYKTFDSNYQPAPRHLRSAKEGAPGGEGYVHRYATQEQERREREAKRRAHLKGLLARAEEVWLEADSLAERKTGSAYDQVSQQIHDLAEAYALADRTSEFRERLEAVRSKFARRPALMKRLKDL